MHVDNLLVFFDWVMMSRRCRFVTKKVIVKQPKRNLNKKTSKYMIVKQNKNKTNKTTHSTHFMGTSIFYQLIGYIRLYICNIVVSFLKKHIVNTYSILRLEYIYLYFAIMYSTTTTTKKRSIIVPALLFSLCLGRACKTLEQRERERERELMWDDPRSRESIYQTSALSSYQQVDCIAAYNTTEFLLYTKRPLDAAITSSTAGQLYG